MPLPSALTSAWPTLLVQSWCSVDLSVWLKTYFPIVSNKFLKGPYVNFRVVNLWTKYSLLEKIWFTLKKSGKRKWLLKSRKNFQKNYEFFFSRMLFDQNVLTFNHQNQQILKTKFQKLERGFQNFQKALKFWKFYKKTFESSNLESEILYQL